MHSLVTAHAGAEGTRENSLEGLKTLLDCGADLLEADLRRAGGELVLSHDRPGSGAGGALLSDALTLLRQRPGLRLNVDLKEPSLLGEAWGLAASLGMQGRVLFTGDAGEDDRRRAREEGLPLWLNYYLLPAALWPRAHLEAAALGFPVLNIDVRRLSEGMLSQAAARLSVWTVDEEAQLRRLFRAGVLNVTTRRPRLALALRREIQGY